MSEKQIQYQEITDPDDPRLAAATQVARSEKDYQKVELDVDHYQRVFVAIEDDRVVGVLNLMSPTKEHPDAYLRLIVVSRTSSGHGVGSLMLSRTLTKLDQEGVPETSLVPADGTERLYQRFGFAYPEPGSPDMIRPQGAPMLRLPRP